MVKANFFHLADLFSVECLQAQGLRPRFSRISAMPIEKGGIEPRLPDGCQGLAGESTSKESAPKGRGFN
jgi:hypothetical protein